MRSSPAWTGAVAVAIAALAAGGTVRADDDVATGEPRAAVPPAGRPSIDLAAHVDINLVLPPHHWRVSGDLRPLVIAGGGRLVIGGNMTIGGEPPGEPAERIRRTDEALRGRLEQLRQERLAVDAADRRMTAAHRRALALAAEVDIRRVTADVARLRDRYADRQANLGDEAWGEFQADVESCRQSLADPFGADSLVAAVRAGFEPRVDGP